MKSLYSHLFRQSISHNSEVVAAVMRHTLQEEKARHPEINEAFYRSDCAGSYASGGLLVPIRHIGRLTGISIKRYDFSEPQARKGPCDRSSAHQKSHVNRFLNEGNDVISAEQVKKALESHGGVRSVVPYVVECPESAGKCPTPRIPDASLLHNYQYCNDGLKVWKAYNIGTGKLVAWENLDKDGKILPSEIRIIESGSQRNRESIKKENTCLAAELPGPVRPVRSPEESGNEDRDCGLFSCPEPGCVKQYITMDKLEKHIAAEKHSFKDVSEPLGDKVIKKWAEQFQQVTSENLSSQLENKLSSLRLTEDLSVTTHQVLQKGWALKVPKRATRFPDKVRNYLQEKFDVGYATGHKADPVQVSIGMRCARDELGKRLFAASECLQTQQIRSFFSRLAAAQRKKVQSPSDLIEDEVRDLESDTQAEQYETELEELREGIIAEVTEKHPICYERFNLCELSQQNKLKKFNIDMLVRICEYFELDIATVSRNRKEGFINQIKEFIGSCSCNM